MNGKLTKLLVALTFLSVLIVSYGQNRPGFTSIQKVGSEKRSISPPLMPELGPYGNLAGLKDAYGNDVFEQNPRPWREGYVIAYRVKTPKGVYGEERFVYAIGDQVTRSRLRIENEKSTNSRIVATEDKLLKISRSVTWDAESNALKSDISIQNVGADDLILKAIEIQIDERMVAKLIKTKAKFRKLLDSVAADPECPIRAGACLLRESELPRSDQPTAECPPCPCGERCHPDWPRARGFWRSAMNSKPIDRDPFVGQIPLFRNSMLCLSWMGGNLTPSILKRGEQRVAQYRIIISRP